MIIIKNNKKRVNGECIDDAYDNPHETYDIY